MNSEFYKQAISNYVIEKFEPRDHYNNKGFLKLEYQLPEYFGANKALRILTPMNTPDEYRNDLGDLNK